MKRLLPVYFIWVSFLLAGCQVKEGIGGTASITGRVYALDYTADFSELDDEYYAPEENVYIVYGDDDFYGDRVDTHYDGTFRFDFLRKGKYTVYVYSEDSTGQVPAGEFPVLREVEITKKNASIDLGDLVIVK